jgi:threonylcarbamoyladenosine tRNA methylthiotransferase MtaB
LDDPLLLITKSHILTLFSCVNIILLNRKMNKKPTISVRTLGCKLNQAESEALSREFASAGYNVTSGDEADVFILNTCSVTHGADRKARQQLRMLRKLNPQALIVVTGCYAEWAGVALKEYGADMVVGNLEKASLPQMLEDEITSVASRKSAGKVERPERTRSFIKIQDGCRNFCSYCIVPLLRSEVYSREADMVVEEIAARVKDGYKEVVLTGTEIGSYDHDDAGLENLIGRILDETGIKRLHLSSLQPQHITKSLLGLWKDPRLVRHFHIALQSGSDNVLKRMKRRYNTARYENAVKMIRELVPDASITTDVIVGFPGETDEEFQKTYDFCARMYFTAMHVFVYSSRPGTLAAELPDKVSEKVKKERSVLMLDLAAHSAQESAERSIGQIRSVLWENEVKPGSGVVQGLTDNYMRVYALSNIDLTNTISSARLTAPANSIANRAMRGSTRGNNGELWSELDEDKR